MTFFCAKLAEMDGDTCIQDGGRASCSSTTGKLGLQLYTVGVK